MKRITDLVAGILGLIVLAAITPLLAACIKLDSPGPAFFVQTRVGRKERLFRCYKFRTMHTRTVESPTHQMLPSDVTRVGRVLRATKIDEVPQLINVILGDMTLIGPRPCLPSQRELIGARRVRGVMEHLPGITGLAQVRGVDMSDPELLSKIDAEYIRTRSCYLDLRILGATLMGRTFIQV